jgi:hypothetical protein
MRYLTSKLGRFFDFKGTLRQVGVGTTTSGARRSVRMNCDPTAREPSERCERAAAAAREAPERDILDKSFSYKTCLF